MKIQAQITVGIASHGVIAIVIIATAIEISPIAMMSNMHIDNNKSTILMSLANLIVRNVFLSLDKNLIENLSKTY